VGFLAALFVNPAFLVVAAGAAVPVALHLIYRRRSREVPFGSLKFLHRSVKRTARRKRLEELLLLGLRVGLILLLAVALARPFLGSGAAPGKRSSTSMILVLDDSGSMTCEHNKKRRFARAKAAAEKLMTGLEKGDLVLLRLASGRKLENHQELTAKRAQISHELARSGCTLARGDLAGQIAAGIEELAEKSTPNRELYVLTDMQRIALRGLPSRLARIKDRRVSVIFVDVSDPDFRNAAVTGVVVRSRTRAAGESAVVQAQVRNTCASPLSPVVSLYLDGDKIAEQVLGLEPGSTGSVSFPCHLATAGVHHGRVEVSADDLAFDNRRYFRTEVLSRIRVLVVEPPASAPAAAGSKPASFYLLRALDPLEGRGLITPQLVSPGEAEKLLLEEYGAVLLSGLQRISPALGLKLRAYVAGGGGLIVFPPQRPDSASYATTCGDRNDGRGPLLAASIGPPLKIPGTAAGGEAKGLGVSGLDTSHQLLLPFKGPAGSAFRQIRVHAGVQLLLPGKSRDRELVTLQGAVPFLVSRDFGQGRSYLFASPADAESSTLPLQKVFLPLLHCMVYDLAELGEHRSDYLVGGQATLSFPGGGGKMHVQLTPPDGRGLEKETSGKENSCSFGPLHDPGIYRYMVLPGGNKHSFVVNPDPDESDSEIVGRSEMSKLLSGFRHVKFCSGPEEIEEVVASVREGRDFSGNILALLLALAVFECFFANHVTGSRSSGKSPDEAAA
jgi:Aerotolerance regulator N-terminal/von Willebrand factor type A domain